MDFNSAHYFSKVVQFGSFTKAAESLGLPKSTLSEKITELEFNLGLTLLVRTTRKLTLTEAGNIFYRKIQPALEQISTAQEEAMDSQQVVTGLIRISVIADFAGSRFIDIISDFRNKYPAISVDVNFDNREIDLVGEGYDLAVRGGKLQDSSLISRNVGAGKFVLVAGKKYQAEFGLPKTPKDIEKHACLRMSPATSDTKWDLQSSNGKKVTVNIGGNGGCSSNSMLAIKNLAQQNQGIALVPLFLCRPDIDQGRLIHVLPEWYMGPRSVHLIYPKVAFMSSRMKEFLPFLEKNLRATME